MARQGKQMRVGVQEAYAYHSVKLGLLATINIYVSVLCVKQG